ncbi:MAG: DNA-protecting protein DprA [Candidatus Omnitrophica bacterium]|nr:DNA-protecting protein DprA [Candidatus Omnitrophota bacterium]
MANKGSILLNMIREIPPRKKEHLWARYPDLQQIFTASAAELERDGGLSAQEAESILRARAEKKWEREIEDARAHGFLLIDRNDEEYPPLLREISFPPLVLYVRGEVSALTRRELFAVVGSRLPTLYGTQMAAFFSGKLALTGLGIVSGLARGIDASAHRAALTGGETIAVLGSGLLQIYPREHRRLAQEIAGQGAVVSEFPLREPPRKENFPRRNRIISGMSRGVLVVEAAHRSGALITARYACEQNRDVFALPGQVTSPLSAGPHALIQDGAKLVQCLDDILQELGIDHELSAPAAARLTEEERKVIDLLGTKGLSLEELLQRTSFARQTAHRILIELQLKGLVKEVRPCYFMKGLEKPYGQVSGNR